MQIIKIFSFSITCILIFINTCSICGEYEFKGERFFGESIQLFDNKTFVYRQYGEFYDYSINGNYNIKGDSLSLDSHPQRDKIIVREKYVKKFDTKIFEITNKRGENISYNLYITLNDGSKKIFESGWGKLKFKSTPIKSFHIITTMGIKSPEYKLLGKSTNSFDIQVETERVFENESWFIDKENFKIKPKGSNGEIRNFFLEKK